MAWAIASAVFLSSALAISAAGCGAATTEADREDVRRADDRAQRSAVVDAGAPVTCDQRIPVYEGGEMREQLCPVEIAQRHFTVIDLSDGWTPFVFTEGTTPSGGQTRQPYRRIYQALADERLRDVPRTMTRERYLELFGIFPTLRVLSSRLTSDENHACHAAIDNAPLTELRRTIRPWGRDAELMQRAKRQVTYLRNRLARAARARHLDGIDALEGDRQYGPLLERYRRERVPVAAVMAMQGHLACDGLLRGRFEEGVLDWNTANSLAQWKRRRMLMGPPFLTAEVREAFLHDGRSGDYDAALRTLRERVISATGLIEDGSARREWGTIFGKRIEGPEFSADAGQPAVEGGAPDLVSPATEAAATALGWTNIEGTVAFFDGLAEGATADLRVAVALPALPAYHSEHMDLRAEVDRGDVWYQYPYDEAGDPRPQPVRHRPVITLFARHEGHDIALVRWGTTIGGWKPELDENGKLGLSYKESPVGARVWRDVVASPAWLPPGNTPDSDLVKRGQPNYDLFGPSYRSAYGLVMLMLHRVVPPRRDGEEERFFDEGVRVHGSVSYNSILRGQSHGCHRLYNHLAVRLGSFVLSHRRHIREGSLRAQYQRTFYWQGQELSFEIPSRGYRFELTPPVPVTVLPGNIRGPVDHALEGIRPLRDDLVNQVRARAAEDG